MTSPLPPALQHLPELIYNLWWTWHQDVWPLFARLDGETWEKTHNPCAALATARPDHLASLANDATYGALLEQSWQRLQNYLHTRQTWLHQQAADEGWLKDHPIAYFSAEYGIHECLPIYSGGLGILSGDHVKSSSDLGIPMVFIGLYYHEGYFRQEIDGAGKQVDQYPVFHPRALPLTLIEKDHAPLKIKVRLSGQEVYAQVWEAKVGINRLLLLDSKLPENSPAAQTITDRLYGGDREMRISQEILLGIGGIRVLKSLGINPCAYHMNEGHAGFFQLERIRDMMHDEHLSFKQAALACAANCIFTTHTPVPAGNEAFRLPVMHKYFYDFIKELKITWNDFLSLGMADDQEGNKYFGLTIFAIRLSRFQNGVSKLHGKVAQRMWRHLWPKVSESENPITSITNGVHVQTWMAPAMKALCQKGLGDNWIEQLDGPTLGQQIENFSDDAWALCRQSLKQEMIAQVRTYLARQYTRQGKTEMAQAAQNFLRENVLTLGFARRFATYKRATLLFKDPKRLAELINDPQRPIQIIFAGKAHPQDIGGQNFIQEIYQLTQRPEFQGKIVILENYDMRLARYLVSGVDVWLNNPRRPMEASGTSGQKVPLNGGINFSVLDGWWREAYNGENGWPIGEERDYPSDEVQDFEDANDFYLTLRNQVVPLFYQTPAAWAAKAKKSMASNIFAFSAQRMVRDYFTKLYWPAVSYGRLFAGEQSKFREEYLHFKKELAAAWPYCSFENLAFSQSALEVASAYAQAELRPHHHVEVPLDDTLPGRVFESVETDIDLALYIGELNPAHIKCEVVITDTTATSTTNTTATAIIPAALPNGDALTMAVLPLTASPTVTEGVMHFQGHFKSFDGRPKRLRFRAYPELPGCMAKFELGHICWY